MTVRGALFMNLRPDIPKIEKIDLNNHLKAQYLWPYDSSLEKRTDVTRGRDNDVIFGPLTDKMNHLLKTLDLELNLMSIRNNN